MTELPTVRNLGLGGDMLGVCTKLFIIEQQHTASTCSDGLVAIKAKCTNLAKSAGVLAFIL